MKPTTQQSSLICAALLMNIIVHSSSRTFELQFRRQAAAPFFHHTPVIDVTSTRASFVTTPAAIRLQRTNAFGTVYYSLTSSSNEKVNISIEYCSGCQWMLRSSWIASELLTTFAKESKLASVALVPKSPPLSPGGIFRVLSKGEADGESRVLWDRSIEGRFPEAKEVKQLVRDVVDPNKDLGHSDVKEILKESSTQAECLECKERESAEGASQLMSERVESSATKEQSFPQAFYDNNVVSIEFSTGPTISSPKNKLHQAICYANDLLNMVYERNAWWKDNKDELQGCGDSNQKCDVPPAVDVVTLIPIREELDVMNIRLNDHIIFDQRTQQSNGNDFNIRTRVSNMLSRQPSGKIGGEGDRNEVRIEMMSDEDAEEARKFFGVF